MNNLPPGITADDIDSQYGFEDELENEREEIDEHDEEIFMQDDIEEDTTSMEEKLAELSEE